MGLPPIYTIDESGYENTKFRTADLSHLQLVFFSTTRLLNTRCRSEQSVAGCLAGVGGTPVPLCTRLSLASSYSHTETTRPRMEEVQPGFKLRRAVKGVMAGDTHSTAAVRVTKYNQSWNKLVLGCVESEPQVIRLVVCSPMSGILLLRHMTTTLNFLCVWLAHYTWGNDETEMNADVLLRRKSDAGRSLNAFQRTLALNAKH
jgi:hypothetical protein